ncbi:hypothetical protein HX126_17405 [Chryseobacterium indologenes]|uniref:hypothetical protein n=1 Tax=Chryseobacterium indologenes TaxID=253 RepID=UPI00257687B6|nr:hypothetical protein [Chryseobacterium indologenes]MDM1556332.1 hypothetical protein [Chryseobacterium indologenes]
MKKIKYFKTDYSLEFRSKYSESIYIEEYNEALIGITSTGITVYNYLHILYLLGDEHNPIYQNLSDEEWDKHFDKCVEQLKIEEECRNFLYGDNSPIVVKDHNFLFETYYEIPNNTWFNLIYN